MPYSYTTYNPTVSTTDFSYSSLDLLTDVPVKDQLKVYKNGQLVPYGAGASGWLVIAGDNIQLGTAVSTGTIKIARESDIVNKEVTFTNSSVLTAQDLNKNSDQLLFLCQELYDKAQDIAVTTAGSLADNSVTEAKLQKTGGSEAVTTSTIRDGAVIEAKIGTNAVTETKIADDAVTEDKILDGAVTTDKIADGDVTTAKIADDAVNNDKMSAGAPTWDGSGNVTVTNDLTVTNNAAVDGNLSFDSGFGSTAVAYGCRAWATWTTPASLTGTYVRSGNTITVTRNSHGYSNGTYLYLDFTSGAGTDGFYQISNVTPNTFDVTDTASGVVATSSVTIRAVVLSMNGISKIEATNPAAVLGWTITLTSAMPDTSYAILPSVSAAAANYVSVDTGLAKSITQFRIVSTGTPLAFSVAVFR